MAQKILKSVIILSFIVGLGILGYSIGSKWHDEKYGEVNRYDLSETLSVIEYSNGEIGVLNNITDKIIGRYDNVLRTFLPEESTHSIRIVVKDGLRGYISARTGEVIFEPQFLYAWIDDPESGLAACVNKDHKLGFVDVQTKKVAIPFQFDYNEDLFAPCVYYGDKRESILDFVFSNGICIVPNKDGKIGIIDKTGKELLPTKYSDIINWRDAKTTNIILKRKSFIVGIGIISEYVDGYIKIDEIIQDTPAFLQGELKKNDVILKIKQDNESEYINVFNIPHEDVLNLIRGEKDTKVTLFVKHEDGTTEDITIVRDEVEDEYSEYTYVYGVCNRNFEMIVPFEYNKFEKNLDFDENFDYYVKSYTVSKDGKYGVLDSIFNVVLPVEYAYIRATDFSTCFIVKNLNENFEAKYGLLNENFELILPIEYDYIEESKTFEFVGRKDYVQKLYDRKGKIVSNFYLDDRDCEENQVYQPIFEPESDKLSNYIQYRLGYRYGVIDINQNVIIPAKYRRIEYLGNKTFSCMEEDNYSCLIKDKR
ncbi:PDZ domain-containing protein [Parabacteroides sp. PF5-9]|uniref:PDZ domain-containing protein n=1 Tax=Parabacteroides sp. PF5-9 TaxID=1742404 RepID=UPI002475C87C|nr:PDZ domain-containing protein [Parabacteroides sp. PF5-9]MDH6357783.1 hypothetical protein [Parabacteroides sp. PF5-9]